MNAWPWNDPLCFPMEVFPGPARTILVKGILFFTNPRKSSLVDNPDSVNGAKEVDHGLAIST